MLLWKEFNSHRFFVTFHFSHLLSSPPVFYPAVDSCWIHVNVSCSACIYCTPLVVSLNDEPRLAHQRQQSADSAFQFHYMSHPASVEGLVNTYNENSQADTSEVFYGSCSVWFLHFSSQQCSSRRGYNKYLTCSIDKNLNLLGSEGNITKCFIYECKFLWNYNCPWGVFVVIRLKRWTAKL